MNYDVDDREFVVPGFDPEGNKLEFRVYEALLEDVHASDAHTEAEIKAFCAGWIAKRKREITPKSQGEALVFAALDGDLDAAVTAIQAGADLNSRFEEAWTPLMCAAKDQPRIVRFLLARGADPNATAPENGYTALMRAAANGNEEIVLLLLTNGADPDLVDSQGMTAERIAEATGQTDTAKLIAARPAKADAKRKIG